MGGDTSVRRRHKGTKQAPLRYEGDHLGERLQFLGCDISEGAKSHYGGANAGILGQGDDVPGTQGRLQRAPGGSIVLYPTPGPGSVNALLLVQTSRGAAEAWLTQHTHRPMAKAMTNALKHRIPTQGAPRPAAAAARLILFIHIKYNCH